MVLRSGIRLLQERFYHKAERIAIRTETIVLFSFHNENEMQPKTDATREQIAAAFNRFSKLLK